MSLELRRHYWEDRDSRAAFKSFIKDIHNLDFSRWEAMGYWDSAYTPFSYFKEGKVIASVCIYLLDAVIAGRQTNLAQISGVGTDARWRKRGLSRELTEMGLAWARDKHEGTFLFADDEAIPYYAKCGFSPLNEYLERHFATPTDFKSGAIQLDVTDKAHLDRIYDYALRRDYISHQFSVQSSKLFMFHALYFLQTNIYEIKDLDCLVCYKRDGNTLSIYDIVSEEIPRFEDIYPFIAKETDLRIEFHFQTDKLGLENVEKVLITENNAFTKGIFPVKDPVFPFTSRA